MPIEKIGNVYYSVTDMDRSVAFYRDVLGLSLKFQDGSNWAAFDVAGTTLALDGTAGQTAGDGGATVSLRVSDLAALVPQLQAAGADVEPVVSGAHEWRTVLRDPDGNRLGLYEPFPRP